MDTTACCWPRILARASGIVFAAALAGCVVPPTSVYYGGAVGDPGTYYDPATVYSSGTYYDPGPVYSPGPYYRPGPYYAPPPVVYPVYPVVPGFGAHFHGHHGDSHRDAAA